MSRPTMLAIAIDAADGRLVRRLAAEGELPALSRLLEQGRWGTVSSPAPVGSGTVWPTFMTGLPPERHGLFGEYVWDAGAMALRRPTFDHLEPFWTGLAGRGARVAVVDVPFAPVVGHARLVEIADWGAHDWFGGAVVVRPAEVAGALGAALSRPHPLVAGCVDAEGPGDVAGLRQVTASLVAGARLRGDLLARVLEVVAPDLLVAVFTEAHRASHLLWHTIDPAHPAWWEGIGDLPADVMRGLVDVFRAIDEQVGRLVAQVGDAAPVLVFALHGMQPARGIPAILNHLLERWGYACPRRWWQRSPRELAGAAARGAKQRLPGPLKAAYYRHVPKSVTMQLAQPSMPLPTWDWAATRAVSLPTDQHGWIRLNLQGRESRGALPVSAYDATCRDLRARLLALSGPGGPLVRDVLITADGLGAPPRALPDLVVHWAPETWRPRVQVVDPPLAVPSVGLKFVAQHDHDGFYLARGPGLADWPSEVEAAGLGQRLERALAAR